MNALKFYIDLYFATPLNGTEVFVILKFEKHYFRKYYLHRVAVL